MATGTRKRLLLVAATTGYQTRIFAEVGRRLGVEVSPDAPQALQAAQGEIGRDVAVVVPDPAGIQSRKIGNEDEDN